MSYNTVKANQSTSYTKLSLLDIATSIMVNRSTAHIVGAQYRYIAKYQKTAHPIISGHTDKEKRTFNYILCQYVPDRKKKTINCLQFAKLWSQKVNGADIFYKTSEQPSTFSQDRRRLIMLNVQKRTTNNLWTTCVSI